MSASRISTLALALGAGLLGGCTQAKQAASDAQRATSPLVGSWKINGDAPPPKANLPQFVILDFSADGKLDASYVAAGGALADVVNTPSKLKREHDSYTTSGDDKLTVVEGSRALEYTYRVQDGKLFLKGADDANEVVFTKQ